MSELTRINAGDAAFTLMSEARGGEDISRRYNSLSPAEQRDVFAEMKGLQSADDTMALFGNVELVDNDRDGIMDDARAMKAGRLIDVYDRKGFAGEKGASASGKGPAGPLRPEHDREMDGEAGEISRPLSQKEISADPLLQQADMMLSRASRGQDIYSRYSGLAGNPNMLEAMRQVQESKPQYGNVRLIDNNGDGILDDARAFVDNRKNGLSEIDVFKTPGDRAAERVQGQADRAARRGGEIIVDEVFRGMGRPGGRGPGAGERILDRMSREGTRGTQRVLKDILRGR
ncbi:MAG: hypothetical protein IPM23_01745 [Candidatus Melainabacteria bacterium]|nr:hypothetical protein [Candidatus Melainabacteria bacterium]